MISVKMKNFYEFLDEFILPTLEEVKAFDLEEEIRKRNERERKKAMERLEEYVEKQDEEKYAVVKITPDERFRWIGCEFSDYSCIQGIFENENGICFNMNLSKDPDAFNYFSMLTGSTNKLLFSKFYVIFVMLDMVAWKMFGYFDEEMITDYIEKHIYSSRFAYQWIPIVWEYFTASLQYVMESMTAEET